MTFAFEEMDIDVFGDTAVIHARYSQVASVPDWSTSPTCSGSPTSGRATDGHWQVVARHSSILG